MNYLEGGQLKTLFQKGHNPLKVNAFKPLFTAHLHLPFKTKLAVLNSGVNLST